MATLATVRARPGGFVALFIVVVIADVVMSAAERLEDSLGGV